MIDAYKIGSSSRRKTTLWTNGVTMESLEQDYTSHQVLGPSVRDLIRDNYFPGWSATNYTSYHFPKFMTRTASWECSFTNKGEPVPGMLFHDHILSEPCAEMKEISMGFPARYTITIGIAEPMRHRILGACMDCNVGTWLFNGFRRIHSSSNTKSESIHLSSSQTLSLTLSACASWNAREARVLAERILTTECC